jgi:hypothetical protein
MANQTAQQIAQVINQAARGLAGRVWEKDGKSRVYLTMTSARNREAGYISLSAAGLNMENCSSDTARQILRDHGYEW